MFKIALKNIIKNRRRSFFNIIAVTIGIFLIIVFLGWYRGVANTMKDSMIDFETGHIQVYNEKYIEKKRKMPLKEEIKNISNIKKIINSNVDNDRLVAITSRIDFSASINYQGKAKQMMGRAIEPENEKNVTQIAQYITKGQYIEGQKGIMVGENIANKLGLKIGDKVFVKAMDKHSSYNLDMYKIKGFFDFGYPKIDNNIFYIDIGSARELLSVKGATSVIVKLTENKNKTLLVESINKNLPDGMKAYPWEDFARVLITQIEGDYYAMMYIFFIMCVLITFGIINTMSMAIQERTNEIGTLRAIGLKKRNIRIMFLYESIILSFIGVVLAFVIASLVSLYLGNVGVDISQYMPENYPMPMGTNLYSDFSITDYLLGAFLGLGISLAGGYFPAKKALKKTITDSLRFSI